MNRYLDWSYQHWTTKNILKHNRRSYEFWHMLFRNRSTRIIKSGNTLCQFCPFLGIWYCSVIFDCSFVRLIITRSGFLYLYIWHLKITVRFCTDAIKIGKTSLKGCLLLEVCSESMWPHKMNVTNEIPMLTIICDFHHIKHIALSGKITSFDLVNRNIKDLENMRTIW